MTEMIVALEYDREDKYELIDQWVTGGVRFTRVLIGTELVEFESPIETVVEGAALADLSTELLEGNA